MSTLFVVVVVIVLLILSFQTLPDIPDWRPKIQRISVSGYMGVNKRGQLPRAGSRRVFTAEF